jgi:hypothetical protein
MTDLSLEGLQAELDAALGPIMAELVAIRARGRAHADTAPGLREPT